LRDSKGVTRPVPIELYLAKNVEQHYLRSRGRQKWSKHDFHTWIAYRLARNTKYRYQNLYIYKKNNNIRIGDFLNFVQEMIYSSLIFWWENSVWKLSYVTVNPENFWKIIFCSQGCRKCSISTHFSIELKF